MTAMLLALNHKALDVYSIVNDMVKEIYSLSSKFPAEEIYNSVQQIRRAAMAVKLNLAEGCTRKYISERRKYIELSRDSLVEVDAVLETMIDLKYITPQEVSLASSLIKKSFAMISRML